MRHLFDPVVPLFLGLAILLLGHGLLYTLLPVGLLAHGMPPRGAAYIASAYFVGMVIGVLAGRWIIEGVGHIRAFAAFAAVAASVSLAFSLLVGELHWIALRLLFGVFMAGILMTAESWLNASAPNDSRGRMLSLYTITTYLAMGSGQFLLNLYDPAGFELFSLAAILLAVALVPISLTRRVSPQLERRLLLSLLRLYRVSPLGLVGTFAAGWMLGPFYGLAPIFAAKVGEGTFAVATFMAAAIFGGLVMQWPIGRLSDRYDRRTVLIITAATAAVIAIVVVAGSMLWPAAALAGAFPLGGVIMVVYPLSVGHTNDFLENGDRVQASGGLIMTFSAGAILGPLVAARRWTSPARTGSSSTSEARRSPLPATASSGRRGAPRCRPSSRSASPPTCPRARWRPSSAPILNGLTPRSRPRWSWPARRVKWPARNPPTAERRGRPRPWRPLLPLPANRSS